MTTFDYIIVGGGSAGCVLANRLSEKPDNKVLLIEAGGRDWNPLFHIPAGFAKMTKGIASWGWETVPQTHLDGRRIWFTQAKVTGGGSSINAQIYTRGNEKDYDTWSQNHGCKGWGYKDVLPYFRKAESNDYYDNLYHGNSGPLHVSNPKAPLPVCDVFIETAQNYGIPLNKDFCGTERAGVGFYQLTQHNARRCSTAKAYLWPASQRTNLTIITRSQADKILIKGDRATGIEIAKKGKKSVVVAKKEIILASGAIGTPYLLLKSGIGPPDHLMDVGIKVVHELKGVGENLHDHINLCAMAELKGLDSYDKQKNWFRAAISGIRYLLFRNGPAASSLFETGAFWFANPNEKYPDIQFHLGLGSGIEKGISNLKHSGITLNTAYLRPKSRGTVRLCKNDPNNPPLIDPNYWSDPTDMEMSLRGLEMARELLQEKPLSDYVKREVLPGSNVRSKSDLIKFANNFAKTDHHPVGTCKMGTDEFAVVDFELKIRGLKNLRVCDASIMPTICSSNTNATTIMIAEKGSEIISYS